jgi:hypothetical protein
MLSAMSSPRDAFQILSIFLGSLLMTIIFLLHLYLETSNIVPPKSSIHPTTSTPPASSTPALHTSFSTQVTIVTPQRQYNNMPRSNSNDQQQNALLPICRKTNTRVSHLPISHFNTGEQSPSFCLRFVNARVIHTIPTVLMPRWRHH